MLEFRLVPTDDEAYPAVLELRRAVLRRPLVLDFTPDDLAPEVDQLHLVGYDGNEPVAVALLKWHSGKIAQMRQVAVTEGRQGQGLGRQLVDAFETLARTHESPEIMMHARQTAVPFYEALGYEAYDAPFEEVGIPHRKMRKFLTSKPD
jgi:predicted GNAT family N-acyltransferase